VPPGAEYASKRGVLAVGTARRAASGIPLRTVGHPDEVVQPSINSRATPAAATARKPPRGSMLIPVAFIATTAIIAIAGWYVRHDRLYTSGSGLGYLLGLLGGSIMLGILLYPLRKSVRFLQWCGPLKYWFKFHMVGGIVGPLLVLFHSTFHVGSFNAGVALSCMFLVVASGLVGRFLYRKIHHGLYGSHATLKELEEALEKQLGSLEPMLRLMPMVKDEVDRFGTLVSEKPEGWVRRSAQFLSFGWTRFRAARRVKRAIAAYVTPDDDHSVLPIRNLKGLRATIDAALRAAQRTAQFAAYERLFALWHVVHIPFLCLLVITAIVHVVAVHIY
jgi:hypothetical protein